MIVYIPVVKNVKYFKFLKRTDHKGFYEFNAISNTDYNLLSTELQKIYRELLVESAILNTCEKFFLRGEE